MCDLPSFTLVIGEALPPLTSLSPMAGDWQPMFGALQVLRPWQPTPNRDLRAPRSPRPVGEPHRSPAPAVDRFDSRPNGIRSLRSRPRHSRSLSVLGEMRAEGPRSGQAMWG